jgi:tetratricopeptide (TPR) repeat protein
LTRWNAQPRGRRLRWETAAAALIVACLLALATWPAAAKSRFALVIGNGAYKSVPALANPPNDAADVAAALKSLGFKVTLKTDLGLAAMQSAIDEFGIASADADVSLLYYAGHGLQLDGRNYLIPVDAEVRTPKDIVAKTVALDPVLAELGKGTGSHLVFLDACRNNPFAAAGVMLPAAGLARVGKLPGFFITFATQPDNVAFDGAGRNSPFATALLGHIATPGADVSSMMIAVRNDVFASTGGRQIPADESLLTKQFYFAGGATPEETLEAQLWRLAGKDRDPNLLAAYLDRYPNGPHANDVRSLLAGTGKPAAPATSQGEAEDLLWSVVRSERQTRLAELYLARYPGGAHVDDAKALIASLRAAEETSSSPELSCERLATHPHDATASVSGVEMDELRKNAGATVEYCRQAVEAHPEIAHYQALLARANYAAERYEEALALYRKAAGAGDTRAMVSLGLMFETGDHTPKDPKAAYALYVKAAERGSPDGALDLAVALIKGKGIDVDIPRALALLRKASDAGSARATYDLAALVAQGVGGKPAGDALALFRRAGAEGYGQGYRAAAVLLDEGRGVPKNPLAAAEDLLRAVAADGGEARAELTAGAQTWSVGTIRELQARLKSAGYYDGAIDGRSGPGLRPALTQWRMIGAPQKS